MGGRGWDLEPAIAISVLELPGGSGWGARSSAWAGPPGCRDGDAPCAWGVLGAPCPPQHAHIRQEIRGMIPKLSSGRAAVQVLCARKARKGFSAHLLLLEKTEDPVGVPVPWVGLFGVLSKT